MALPASLLLATVGVGLWAWFSTPLAESALSPASIASVRVLDREGRLLREVLSREDGRSTWVPLSRVSPHLVAATLAGEDRRFYRHGGVDLLALARAVLLLTREERVVSGASTLTMQLARLLVPGIPHTLAGKLQQAALALRLERRLSKDEILWQYLNRAPYGNGTFGVEAASRRYFNQPAARLSLAQASLLAALPRGPALYDPYRHRQRLVRRQQHLLALMQAQGSVTARQRRMALREPLDLEAASRPFLAPHAVLRALELARSVPGGQAAVTLRTTLDLPLQQRVEASVARSVRALSGRGVTNAAVLVLDNDSGDILAHVGSAAFFDEQSAGQVDGTRALRQPGSAIKPFTYALALELGKTPASLLMDLPVHFTTDQGDYAPRNYDDSFHGPVRLRVALGSSYNVPAVRLAEYVGVERLLRRLHDLGFDSLGKSGRHYGLGLTLGNGEVTLLELTAAFAALARGGSLLRPRLLLEARTARGQELALPPRAARRVFPREVSYLVSDILADPLARLPAFGRDSPLALDFPAAAKTGTSKDFRDNWTVGFTPRFTVGVWTGNFDGSSMHNVSGVTGAGPLWAEVMTLVMQDVRAPFRRPAGLLERRICPLSGALATERCPASVTELFTDEARLGPCAFHQELALHRQDGLLAGPACPEAEVERRPFTVYPPAYRAWAVARGVPPPPTSYSPRCPRGDRPARVVIRFPSQGDRFHVDPDLELAFQTLPLQAAVDGWVPSVTWLLDGRTVATAPFPYSAEWPLTRGRHQLLARLPDGTASPAVDFTVE